MMKAISAHSDKIEMGEDMRKPAHVFAICSLGLLLTASGLVGCTNTSSSDTSSTQESVISEELAPGTGQIVTNDGASTFSVPSGWVVAEEESTSDEVYFIKEGSATSSAIDNISITWGETDYSSGNAVSFAEDVRSRLVNQVEPGEQFYGSGTTTSKGYPLVVFTYQGSTASDVQYYIVGDYECVLVHESNFSGDPSVDAAAQSIVESFTWAKDVANS